MSEDEEKQIEENRRRLDQSFISPLGNELEEHGLTADFLINKLLDEIDAKDVKFFVNRKDKIRRKAVPAWVIRQRARQDAHKLRGDYPAEQMEHKGGIIVSYDVKPVEKDG